MRREEKSLRFVNRRFSGFTLMEMLISMVVISILMAASVPMLTQFSTERAGVDKNSLQCITGNNSTGWYDTDGAGATTLPAAGSVCYAAVVDAQFNRGRALSTDYWYAEHGTANQQSMARKIMRAACDLGGDKACDYFINKCRTSGAASAPYCDDTSDYTDLTYYLHLDATTYNNSGATYIVNQLEGLLPKMMTNLVNEVFYSCTTDPNLGHNLACELAKPEVYIKACNNGYAAACTVANTNHYNRSCHEVKSVWAEAPTGTYKLTYNGAGAPVSVSCDMTSIQSATITGCNASPYVPDDCTYGYNNSYNRTCEMVRLAWPYGPTGTYNLTTNGPPATAPVSTSCTMPDPNCTDTVGALCPDGTKFAGTYNGDYYFTTVSDEGSTTYNNGTYGIYLNVVNDSDGKVNSATILSASNSESPYQAAEACKALNTSSYAGKTDWYLPSKNELLLVYANRVALGNNFQNVQYTYYWSSTEYSASHAYPVTFYNTGGAPYGDGFKPSNLNKYVRCMRQQNTQDASCTAIGATCTDGTKYAGISGTGKYLYIKPTDEIGTYKWNNGTSAGMVVTAATSSTDGRANTNKLVASTDSGAPYSAANLCYGRATSNHLGHNYWFLPSKGEMASLFSPNEKRVAIGNFSNTNYWTSTEYGDTGGYTQELVIGYSCTAQKIQTNNVRCVRKQDVPLSTCIGTPGALCTDGTYYVAFYGGRHLYVAPADEPGLYEWGPGSQTTGATNSTNGNNNMTTLTALGISNYPAANICNSLNSVSYKGHTDWYLPSSGEAAQLTMQTATLGLSGTYFSSTECGPNNANHVSSNYPGSIFSSAAKWSAIKVRCMRDD